MHRHSHIPHTHFQQNEFCVFINESKDCSSFPAYSRLHPQLCFSWSPYHPHHFTSVLPVGHPSLLMTCMSTTGVSVWLGPHRMFGGPRAVSRVPPPAQPTGPSKSSNRHRDATTNWLWRNIGQLNRTHPTHTCTKCLVTVRKH